MKEQELLEKIRAYGFSLVELNLFLDTHPTDKKARDQFNEYAARFNELKEEYFRVCGPLFSFGLCPAGDDFRWVNEPWPWEN